MKIKFLLLVPFFIIKPMSAIAEIILDLQCQESIYDTKNYGPVAITVVGTVKLPLKAYPPQSLLVTTNNAIKKTYNVPSEAHPATVKEVFFLKSQNSKKNFYAVKFLLNSASSALNRNQWFVCEDVVTESDMP